MDRTIRIVREGHPDEPGLDTAISRAMLLRASDGSLPETFRLHVPGRIVAFGRRDTLEPGYRRAVAAAAAGGYVPVERIAGGRAAVFHEGTLAFSWAIPDDDPRSRVQVRFRELAEVMVRAFRDLGVPAEVGEVPGEYCPGEWSVNVMGRFKVMGVGQRLARHATHVGGVVVVTSGAAVNEILEPVYAALGLHFDPRATGALEDAVPGITVDEVAKAIVAQVESLGRTLDARLDPATLEMGRSLVHEHLAWSKAS